MCFLIFWKENNAFLDYKYNRLKELRRIFIKWLTLVHGFTSFWSKIGNFSIFFKQNMQGK